MEKAEILKALDDLRAEVEKKPEDKIAEKLDEILRAIQALPWHYPYHVCPPCTRPHYPYGTWVYPNGTLTTGSTGIPNGTTWTNARHHVTFTGGN